MMESGKVKYFNAERGFGFIKRDTGADVFVHITAVRSELPLELGQTVHFDVERGDKGLFATNVSVVDE